MVEIGYSCLYIVVLSEKPVSYLSRGKRNNHVVPVVFSCRLGSC